MADAGLKFAQIDDDEEHNSMLAAWRYLLWNKKDFGAVFAIEQGDYEQ
jgi:hypothetical protein